MVKTLYPLCNKIKKTTTKHRNWETDGGRGDWGVYERNLKNLNNETSSNIYNTELRRINNASSFIKNGNKELVATANLLQFNINLVS